MRQAFSLFLVFLLVFGFLHLATQTQIVSADSIPASTNTVTRHIVISSSGFGRGPTDPPVVDVYGIWHVSEFTMNTDKAYYEFHLPSDLVPGTDILVHVHWTRSTTGDNENGKTVKWQVKYLVVNSVSRNINAGESTLTVQDMYDSVSTTDQIMYATDYMTMPGENFYPEYYVVIELMAITPTGTALSNPACTSLAISYTSYYEERSGLWVIGAVALGLAVFAVFGVGIKRINVNSKPFK